jgi:hypothetical protein
MLKDILKHLLIMVTVTVAIVFTMPYCKQALQELIKFYPVILRHLSYVFAGGKLGMLIKEVIAIIALPLVVSAVVSLAYYVIRRNWLPHLINITWILWIIVVSSVIVLRG